MKRIAWLTDIHLNFVEPAVVDEFLGGLVHENPDAVFLTGDIAEAHDVVEQLRHIDSILARPIYFVLGNHDFYFGSIARTRAAVEALCQELPHLHYLTACGPLELTSTIGIVGHDGWADARLGDYERSYVMMNDYKLIEELSHSTKLARWPLLKQLGDEAAAHIRQVLPAALARYEEVYLLTHVPPLREACWHQGAISDDEWAPHFTCLAMGEAILEIARQFPERRITVLCGHTHGSGTCEPLPNVVIHTGGATYGYPALGKMFILGGAGG